MKTEDTNIAPKGATNESNGPVPSPEDIDRAMLADKLVDGYFQRKVANAIRLEQQHGLN
jgi:hypothetical protein